jgi:hypothetical protein
LLADQQRAGAVMVFLGLGPPVRQRLPIRRIDGREIGQMKIIPGLVIHQHLVDLGLCRVGPGALETVPDLTLPELDVTLRSRVNERFGHPVAESAAQ